MLILLNKYSNSVFKSIFTYINRQHLYGEVSMLFLLNQYKYEVGKNIREVMYKKYKFGGAIRQTTNNGNVVVYDTEKKKVIKLKGGCYDKDFANITFESVNTFYDLTGIIEGCKKFCFIYIESIHRLFILLGDKMYELNALVYQGIVGVTQNRKALIIGVNTLQYVIYNNYIQRFPIIGNPDVIMSKRDNMTENSFKRQILLGGGTI